MTWKQLTEDCRKWKLLAIDPHDRDTWRSAVRSAMHAASQLPQRGTQLLWILPLYLHVNKKSDDEEEEEEDLNLHYLSYYRYASFV